MILDTYDPTTMTRKDLYHKIFVAKEPEEGEQPRVLKKAKNSWGKALPTLCLPSHQPGPRMPFPVRLQRKAERPYQQRRSEVLHHVRAGFKGGKMDHYTPRGFRAH